MRLARTLRGLGVRAGMALRPATPVEPYADLLGELDMLLLMTVEPGFGGQKFLDLVLPKIRTARELVKGRDLDLWIQVDGGVSARDRRAVRRGRRRRVRGRLGGLRRRRPGRGDRGAPRAGRGGHRGLLVGPALAHAGQRLAARPVRGTLGATGTNAQRAPGSVRFRTGGDSPRPVRDAASNGYDPAG